MNNPYQMYGGGDVPMIRHTDWASVAKQWASLRATVNIRPSHVVTRGDVDLRQIPPPPPPPPSPPAPSTLSANQTFSSYIDPYEKNFAVSPPFSSSSYAESHNNFNHYDESVGFDRQYLIDQSLNYTPLSSSTMTTTINDDYYRNYGKYDNEINNHDYYPNTNQLKVNKKPLIDNLSSNFIEKCETFDYNHGNEDYNYYESAENYESCVPSSSSTVLPYAPNLWNHPPPDHPDVHLNYVGSYRAEAEVSAPKLFPILNDFRNNTVAISHSYGLISTEKSGDDKMCGDLRRDTAFISARQTKGLPAWIIDDMKKMKEKEHKKSHNSMEIYKDSHVHSRRDYEGDVVMEDVVKEVEIDRTPGKNVTKHPIAISTTETDIDDVSLHDDDEIVTKIDYSSKSLADLVEMLDENEIASLKISVIRNSLTEVMKEITDDMIFNTVKSMFSRELSKGKKSHKHKGKNGTHDSSPVKQQPEVISQLLGLDVYESDDDQNIIPEIKTDSTSQCNKDDKINIQKHSHSKAESDKVSKVRSSRGSKEKTRVSVEISQSSKEQHRSRSRDNGKSKDKRRSHKKSKKHSGSEDKWNHDNYERSRKKH